jgi:hypothetical protein
MIFLFKRNVKAKISELNATKTLFSSSIICPLTGKIRNDRTEFVFEKGETDQ